MLALAADHLDDGMTHVHRHLDGIRVGDASEGD